MRPAAIAFLLVASCSGLTGAPAGDYQSVGITGGSLLVSEGECAPIDWGLFVSRANLAIENMRVAWGDTYPEADIAVHGMRVAFTVDPRTSSGHAADGLYHHARWIELRCGLEQTIKHELYHAVGHKLGVACFRQIEHTVGLDCLPWSPV